MHNSVKEFKSCLGKPVEVYYRRPIRLASDLGGIRVVMGAKGTLSAETRHFIKLSDLSDIVRDDQAFGAQEQRREELPNSIVYINKNNIGELYVKE